MSEFRLDFSRTEIVEVRLRARTGTVTVILHNFANFRPEFSKKIANFRNFAKFSEIFAEFSKKNSKFSQRI